MPSSAQGNPRCSFTSKRIKQSGICIKPVLEHTLIFRRRHRQSGVGLYPMSFHPETIPPMESKYAVALMQSFVQSRLSLLAGQNPSSTFRLLEGHLQPTPRCTGSGCFSCKESVNTVRHTQCLS